MMRQAPWGHRGPRSLSMAHTRLSPPVSPHRDEARWAAALMLGWRGGGGMVPRRLLGAAQPPASRTGCSRGSGTHAASFSSPRRNEYHLTQEAYLYAIADAMREEYHRIVEARFLLQIDDPRLVSYYGANLGLSPAQCLERAELRVEVLNYALCDIPPEKVRYHTCYGMNIGLASMRCP